MPAVRLRIVRVLLLALTLPLLACDGPGRVQYDAGRCSMDGRPLSASEVEANEAAVARRIASRQPWFTVITISVVLLAAAGNAERALLLVRGRHAEGHRPLLERLRDVLARQREKPALFKTIVGGSLAAILIAGGAYIYLDVDKRASERALGMLQFCHLALRTQQEEGVLDEQRRNLKAIESTAGDIRSLVGRLPPDQQRKAQLIVDQIDTALDRQGRIVGEYVARTDEAQRDLSTHTIAMEKGLASVEGELSGLRTMPADLKDLEGAAHHIDETTASFDGRFADLRAHLATVDGKLDALLARPPCAPPAAPSPARAASSATAPPAPSVAMSSGADAGRAPGSTNLPVAEAQKQ
jgi:hypothetical protein